MRAAHQLRVGASASRSAPGKATIASCTDPTRFACRLRPVLVHRAPVRHHPGRRAGRGSAAPAGRVIEARRDGGRLGRGAKRFRDAAGRCRTRGARGEAPHGLDAPGNDRQHDPPADVAVSQVRGLAAADHGPGDAAQGRASLRRCGFGRYLPLHAGRTVGDAAVQDRQVRHRQDGRESARGGPSQTASTRYTSSSVRICTRVTP